MATGGPLDERWLFESEELKPTAIDPRKHLHYIEISENGLVATFVGRGEYTDVGAVQADKPLPRRCSVAYFEVKVLEASSSRAGVCIGLSPSSALLNRPPGLDAGSVGYRGEDGYQQSRHAIVEAAAYEAFGPPFGRGDIVGCGIINSSQGVFFTKNGAFLGHASKASPVADLYPTASLKHTGNSIRMNFSGPFIFNLRLLLHRQLMEERQLIRQEQLPPEALTSLVRSYLLHSGFERTLKAFNEAVGKPKGKQKRHKQDNAPVNAVSSSLKDSPRSKNNSSSCNNNNHSNTTNNNHSNSNGSSNNNSNSSRENSSSVINPSNGREDKDDEKNAGETKEAAETAVAAEGEETTPLASAYQSSDEEGEKEERECILTVWPPAVPQRLSASLTQRSLVMQAIMEGNIPEAVSLLNVHFPLVMAPSHDDACSLARVLLLSQEVVEALRPPKKDLKSAISCMKQNISPLMREVSPLLQKVASECLGILAYEDPTDSPVAHVFHLSRRSLTATAVNRSILKKHLHVAVWSPLELLVRHLVVCRQVLRTLGGSRGPIPSSREFAYPLPLRQTIEALEAELL